VALPKIQGSTIFINFAFRLTFNIQAFQEQYTVIWTQLDVRP